MLVAMPAAVMARLQAGTASLVARGSIILSAVVQKAFSPLNAFTSKPLHQPFLLLQKPIIKIAEQTKQMAAWLGNGLQYPLKMIQGIKGTFSSWLGKLVKATMANGPQKAETEAAARYAGFWAKMRDKLKRKKKKPLTIVEDTHDDDVPETREPLAPIRAQLSWQKNPS